MSVFEVEMRATVRITVNDPTVLTRATENHDEHGNPRPEGDPEGWRSGLYPLHERDDVLNHLAYNAVVNGVRDPRQLDGWADLSAGDCSMEVTDADMAFADEVSS